MLPAPFLEVFAPQRAMHRGNSGIEVALGMELLYPDGFSRWKTNFFEEHPH
jgi:hypothetical protein